MFLAIFLKTSNESERKVSSKGNPKFWLYVGSTYQELSTRLSMHRPIHRGYLKDLSTAYKIFEMEDYNIVPIETTHVIVKKNYMIENPTWQED